MQTYFEQELAKLRKRIIKMLNLVNGQLEKSFHVLYNGEIEAIEEVKHTENKIDKLDIKIDKLCQRIFALAQPVATDLRFIMASLKIDNELERIGDIAYEITERSEAIYNFADVINQFQMQELTQNISKIYNQTIEAYINNNNLLANEVIANCKQAETLSKSIFKEIVAQMVDKSEVIVVATDLILIVRELERIIGHIENIAESIVFIVDAKILKHPEVQAMKKEAAKKNEEEKNTEVV